MLTDTDREMLKFSRLSWQFPGARESAIRERFGMSELSFHQRINRLIDNPAALVEFPLEVRRLERVRARGRRSRRVG